MVPSTYHLYLWTWIDQIELNLGSYNYDLKLQGQIIVFCLIFAEIHCIFFYKWMDCCQTKQHLGQDFLRDQTEFDIDCLSEIIE